MAARGYYDINAILSEQQTVPTELATDLIKLGHFDANQDGPDLRKGTKIDLPFWLVQGGLQSYATVHTPKVYTMPYRQTLKADAKVPNLFEWNEFFFEFGMEYSKLRRDGEMAELLVDAFGSRYTRVMDLSQNAVDEDMSELTRNLDALERRLFATGRLVKKEFTNWQHRRIDKITTAVSVDAVQRKRKRP